MENIIRLTNIETPIQFIFNRTISNASPDEQALFWKLLHNYYAIIARPRFGKRFDSSAAYSQHPFVGIVKHNAVPSYPSEYDMGHILNANIPNENPINVEQYYTIEYPDRRRRRRR